MTADRSTIRMDTELCAAVRDAAARAGLSVSAWLAEAAAERLRHELLGRVLDAWEQEAGSFSDAELDAAAAASGVLRRSPEP